MIDIKEYDRIRSKLLAEVRRRPSDQEEIAQEIGILLTTFHKILKGKKNVNHFTLWKIADFFNKKGR